MSFVVRDVLIVVCCVLSVVCRLLFVVRSLLCCLLLLVDGIYVLFCCVVFVLFDVYGLLVVGCLSSVVGSRLPLLLYVVVWCLLVGCSVCFCSLFVGCRLCLVVS